jgi:hypothetical protein
MPCQKHHAQRSGGLLVAALLSSLAGSCSSSTGSDEVAGGDPRALCRASHPAGAAEPPASPLRRLTRLEYNNTARDLFGFDLAPADGFPADEVAGGFSNNASVLTVSPLLAEKYLEAAEKLAAEAVKNLTALLPCDPAAMGEEPCARQFVQRFGRRALRRPLEAPDVERLMRAFAAGRADGSFAEGIEVVIRAALQSPSFLYRFEIGGMPAAGEKLVRLTQPELASRLSYFLWGSMPDDNLSAAADAGGLGSSHQVAQQARIMLQDPRARRAVTEFHRQWLGVGTLDTLVKDAQAHPEFTEELRVAMRAELPAFIDHLIWSADRRLATLLTAPLGFASGPLATLYGVAAPGPAAGADPQMVSFPPGARAGVLTQAAVLAVHALPDQSSPVMRGKFVRERFLCQEPPPPPPDLNVTPPEVDPSQPTRERFAQHTASPSCAVCHQLMDPIGFGFEGYDAIGRLRTMDGGRAVDESGWVVESDDLDGPFRGAGELGEKLAQSGQVRDCVATQWFRYAFGRHEAAVGDACSLAAVRKAFTSSGGDIRELLVALTQTESFLYRRAHGPEGVSP